MFQEKVGTTMSPPKKTSSNTEQQYRSIMELYEMAEELASTVDARATKNPGHQLGLVEPLIEQVTESSDVLTEEFISLHENKGKPRKTSRSRIEGALRRLFMAVEEYYVRARSTRNLADTIVEKIRKQTEKITLIFLQLLELSLERIMHKQEIDAFRKFGQKLGFAIPQHSHGSA